AHTLLHAFPTRRSSDLFRPPPLAASASFAVSVPSGLGSSVLSGVLFAALAPSSFFPGIGLPPCSWATSPSDIPPLVLSRNRAIISEEHTSELQSADYLR